MTDLATTQELEACEEVIERGLKTFVEVGNALAKIREEKLYRQEYSTFENYCRDRWDFTQQYATSLVRAATLTETIVSKGLPAPTNEGQARELSKIIDPGERVRVWERTLERTGDKPTAKAIREAHKALKEPPVDEVEVSAVIPPVEGGDAEDTCPTPVGDFNRGLKMAKNILGNLCDPQFGHRITEDEYTKTKRLLEASLKQLERNYQK